MKSVYPRDGYTLAFTVGASVPPFVYVMREPRTRRWWCWRCGLGPFSVVVVNRDFEKLFHEALRSAE